MENTEKRNIGALGIIAVFAVMIAYSTLMDYLHYAFFERHKEILGYYYDQNILILPAFILFFVSVRLFVLKSLFFKKIPIAANIAIFAVFALVFVTFSASALLDSAKLTKDGVTTKYSEYGADCIAEAKIGIRRSYKSYEQYIELGMIREKSTFRFNTFQNNYTIADFYDRYNGKLFFDGTDKPVEIEVFGLEYAENYLSGTRLVSHKVAARLWNFCKEQMQIKALENEK